MRLILHVGMAKTGTSTLQHALNGNEKTLARSGVLYPKPAFRKSNHNYLSALCMDDDRMPREFLQRGATRTEALSRATEFWADLEAQVQRSKMETTVLSGEYFYGLNAAGTARFADLLRPVFDQIELIVYVREPTAYYVSLMQQRVKGAASLRPPSDFRTRVRICVPRLAEAFDGSVTVRSFERSALVDGDIVTDFVSSVLGLPLGVARALKVEDQNTSMSAEAMCILQLLRRHGFAQDEGKFAPESNYVIRRLDELREEIPQSAPLLRAEIAASVVRRHAQDLRYLVEEFDVAFDDIVTPLDDDDPDPTSWDSAELVEILDVGRDQVDRVLGLLLKDLASSAVSPRRS